MVVHKSQIDMVGQVLKERGGERELLLALVTTTLMISEKHRRAVVTEIAFRSALSERNESTCPVDVFAPS